MLVRVNESPGDLCADSEGSNESEQKALHNEATCGQKFRHEGESDIEEWGKRTKKTSYLGTVGHA